VKSAPSSRTQKSVTLILETSCKLMVTREHQVVEFTPEPCFKPFGDAVSDARRAGDADPRKAIIADTMKLLFVSFLLFFFHVLSSILT